MPPRSGERGQASAEYIAVLILIGMVVLLVAAESGLGPMIRGRTAEFVCHVLHASCGASI